MFSPNSATPLKRGAPTPLGSVPFASPTFTSIGSSFKRKRDQLERSEVKPVGQNFISVVQRSHELSFEESMQEVLFTKVFITGDVLMLRRQTDTHCNLSFYHEAGKSSNPKVSNVAWPQTPQEASQNFFDLGKNSDLSTDLVACSRGGSLILITIAADGAVSAYEHKVLLSEEEERITSICHAGNVLLLGSSSEELYLIRREGRAVSADRLQRSQSMLKGLFQTTAKLIGILPARDRSTRIVRILPIPLSPLLVGVGNSMTMWSEWSSPGRERLVWEFKLKQTLRSDLRETLGATVTKLRIVDTCLMQTELGASSARLLVLSVTTDAQVDDVRSQDGESAAQVRCTLWLHSLQIATPPTGVFNNSAGEAPARVLSRVLVCENVQFNMLSATGANGESTGELGTTQLKPKIISLLPSWRVYVCWSAHSFSAGANTLQCAQFDALNQPELRSIAALPPFTSTMSDEQMAALRGSAVRAVTDSVRCTDFLDSLVESRLVVDTSPLNGQDGVCALLTDGTLMVVLPPLPERVPGAFPAHPKPASKVIDTDLGTLLMAIATGEANETLAASQLRDVSVSVHRVEVEDKVATVSKALLARRPTGQYWGTSSSLKGLTGQALTRYQMVHRLVDDKLQCHRRLIAALDAANLFTDEAMKTAVLADHQQLLLCAGLSGAVQESQQRLSNSTANVRPPAAVQSTTARSFLTSGLLPDPRLPTTADTKDAAQQFADLAHRESLKVITAGMDIAVRRVRKSSLQELESQGLSIVDEFFSEASQIVDGVLAIATALKEAQTDLIQREVAFPAAYGVTSTVLQALNHTKEGEGAQFYGSSVVCHPTTRKALLMIVELLQAAVNSIQAELPAGFTALREGKRVKELCTLLLFGFVVEATHAVDSGEVMVGVVGDGEGGEHMSTEWRAEYHGAKTACATLLLSLRLAQLTFALSEEFLFFSGLMEAVELDRPALQSQLDGVVRTKGHLIGTDNVALATACLLWLEENNRPADILQLGVLTKSLLDEFLESRPHLSWMNHIKSGRHGEATQAAVAHARHVPSTVKAETLLSIAKLSSILAAQPVKSKTLILADQSPASSSAKALSTPSPYTARFMSAHSAVTPVRGTTAAGNDQQGPDLALETAVTEANANLAVLKSQDLLRDYCSSEFPDPTQRMSVADLVLLVIRMVESQQDCADSSAGSIQFDRPLDASDVTRMCGIGLSLLSMEGDVLDSMLRSLAAQPAGRSQRDLAELQKQKSVLHALLVSLWGAVIKVQTTAWLQLALIQDLSFEEEDTIRSKTVFYQVALNALSEVVTGTLRADMVPSDSNQKLLEEAIEASGVAKLGIDDEGEVRGLAGEHRNHRAVHVLKVTVGLAVGSVDEVVEQMS